MSPDVASLLSAGASAEEALAGLSDEECEVLLWDWSLWARPEQRLPTEAWRVWLVLAGRGFGKTRTGAEAVRDIMGSGEVGLLALMSKTPADARDVMVEGPAGILAVSPPSERPIYEPSKRRLTWPNGAVGIVYSGQNPDALRGPQHQLAWTDELCAYQYPTDSWDNLVLSTRLPWKSGGPARIIATTTPRPIPALRSLLAEEGLVVTRGSTFDNRANLDPTFIGHMRKFYEGTRLGRQELFAEVLEDVAGALWTYALLERQRTKDYPELRRVVVAVDPAVTSSKDSDETGIVVVGVGVDGRGYVLEDVSLRGSPEEWAARAVRALVEWEADEIVAEVNNGGDLVRSVIHVVDKRVPVRMVRASRGKTARAEPIAALYSTGQVHHVGMHRDLEDQMTTFAGKAAATTSERGGAKSPDRLDALVWGLAFTMLSEQEKQEFGFA